MRSVEMEFFKQKHTTTDENGFFKLNHVARGPYKLSARKPRWGQSFRTNVVIQPGTSIHNVGLVLQKGGVEFRGILDVGARENSSAYLTLTSEDGLLFYSGHTVNYGAISLLLNKTIIRSQDFTEIISLMTNRMITISNMVPGKYSMEVRSSGYQTISNIVVDIASPGPVIKRIKMHPANMQPLSGLGTHSDTRGIGLKTIALVAMITIGLIFTFYAAKKKLFRNAER
jgi:hypothetical protein